MNEAEALFILKQPNGSEKLAAQAEEAFAPSLSLLAQEEAAAAAFLVRLARQKKYREAINKWLGDRTLLYRLLGSDDAKMRKNTARLIGQLKVPADDLPLAEALAHESKRLVRPSMILALGALKTPAATQALQAYQVEPAQEAAEEKHVREEKEALRTALGAFQTRPVHGFQGLPGKTPLELRCGRHLEKELAKELAGLEVRAVRPGCVTAVVGRWEEMSRSRIWREALIPLSRSVSLNTENVQAVAEAVAKAAAHKMTAILKASYGGEPPYAFRVELAGQRELTKAISKAVETMSSELVNTPSSYEAELRVEEQRGKAALYLKLCLAPDHRFAYRKAAVPASIHPANAAGVVRLAAPYLKEGASVLDPCCGSGTLLIERGLYQPCKALTGVDIQRSALQAAAENVKGARLTGGVGRVSCRLVCSDLLKFTIREPVDELFANLPFGNRVGSHAGNLPLYKGLVQRLPQWVRPGGIAVLYTMEGKLLEQCLYGQRQLQILKCGRMEAGGLEPKIFIVKVLPRI